MRQVVASFFMVAALCSQAALAQVEKGHDSEKETKGNWHGLMLEHDGQTLFRAMTVTDKWALAVDARPPLCRAKLQLLFDLRPHRISQDLPRIDVDGAFKVDENDVWPIKLSTAPKIGDRVMIYAASSNEETPVMFDQMRNGKVLRTKLTLDQQDFAVTFSLDGFGPMLADQLNDCRVYAQTLQQTSEPMPVNGAASDAAAK